jgi:hypothetical protein
MLVADRGGGDRGGGAGVVAVREAAVPSSPRWCWSPIAAVALVVVVAVVCWSPIAAVGRVPRGRGG